MADTETARRNPVNAVALAATAMVVAFLGCTGRNERIPARVSFATKYAPIEFSFPAGWYANSADNPYDLQCFSQSKRMNTGVFAYKTLDIAAGSTPIDIFWQQINDLKSKRKNFEELEALQKREHADKTITSITYIGDKDSSRNCYRFALIEFAADDSRFAVVLQVGIPGEWEKSKPALEEITQSAKPLPDRD